MQPAPQRAPAVSQHAALNAVSAEVRHAVRAILKPDETVLWAGRPVASAAWGDMMPATVSSRFWRIVLFLVCAVVALQVLFYVVVFSIGALWETVARGGFGPSQWPVLGLILFFMLWLGYQLVIRLVYPFVSILLAKRSAYVLTSRQALIARRAPDGVRLQRFELGTVEAPTLQRLRKDGVGDLMFDGQAVLEIGHDGSSDGHVIFETGFTACPGAERVLEQFKQARAQRRAVYERDRIDALRYDHAAETARDAQAKRTPEA